MFDVGFSELALIFGVSLVVLGPKKLPGLVNKVGRWVGKARVMANDFRRQLENEVNIEELNRLTDLQSQQNAKPIPPPGANGEPEPEVPTYPYSASPVAPADSPAVDAPASTPSPADDTYSHAHAEGDAPMPWTPEPAEAPVAAEPTPDTPVTNPDAPQQAMLDLPVPDDTQRHA